MEIRLAIDNDYQAILALYKELHQEDKDIEPEFGSNIFKQIQRSDWLQLFVAQQDHELLATCYLNIIPNLTRAGSPYGVIENVVTTRRARGMGLGKEVVTSALDYAWQQGCYKVMLMTGSHEPATHRFYKRCGFVDGEKTAYLAKPNVVNK